MFKLLLIRCLSLGRVVYQCVTCQLTHGTHLSCTVGISLLCSYDLLDLGYDHLLCLCCIRSRAGDWRVKGYQ